jgi:hypothetical protein
LRESLEIRRELATRYPAQYLGELANAVNNLSNGLARGNERELARSLAQEAVALFTRLADRDSSAYGPRLAIALDTLGLRIRDAQAHRRALRFVTQAALTLVPFFVRQPRVYVEWMSAIVRHLEDLSHRVPAPAAQLAWRRVAGVLFRISALRKRSSDVGIEWLTIEEQVERGLATFAGARPSRSKVMHNRRNVH